MLRKLSSVTAAKRSLSTEWSSKKDEQSAQQISVPSEADVVIIGGGSVGCQTLYHLAKRGVTNAVLLEKDSLTAGTTWHTAGLVWRLRPSDVEIQLLSHMVNLVNSLEEETQVNPGWINNGGIFIANNKERLDEYKRLGTIAKPFGIETYVLSPEETKKLYPLMNVDDIYGTLYSPGDGTIDPNGLCQALTRSATRAGCKVVEGVPVTDILTENSTFDRKRVVSVETPYGSIKTKHVVNCTGVWANYCAAMVGLDIPLLACKHAYVTTERIPGIENMPNIRDHDASVYLKLQGDALHVGGYEVNPCFWDEVEKKFAFGLFELDWDVFGVHIEGAVNRVPCLEQTGIKSTVCGPESFTPDHKPLLGEDPRVQGFFHGCGFNSGGMMLGAGAGKELANWIVDGRPEFDLYGYDIRRFCPEVSRSKQWVKERSHEAYAKNYSMVFTHDEPLAGRNMKKDPLHEELSTNGCVFQERFGWERPGWFSVNEVRVQNYDWYGAYETPLNENDHYKDYLNLDYTFNHPSIHENIRAECLSTRYRAALFDMSYFGKFWIKGPDAQAAVNWIFSNDMEVPIGRTVYTCMLNKRAGIEADLTVSACGNDKSPEFYVAAAGGSAYQAYAHILTTLHEKNFNVTLEDVSRDMGMLSLQGPLSRRILQKLTPGNTDLSEEGFPFSTCQTLTVAGHQVLALRVSFVGEVGWELHIPRDACVPIYRSLMEAGRPLGLVNAGYRAIDSLSIEKGYPHWHQEIRMDDNPFQAGLGFTCKLKTSMPFQGRTALEALKGQGLSKKKVCFTLQDKSVCLIGMEAVVRNDQVIGFIRRADYGFFIDMPIAYGYVSHPDGGKINAEWLKSGDYQLESMGKRFPAKLHMRSPFDAENKRVKGDYANAPTETEALTSFLDDYKDAMENRKAGGRSFR